MSYFPSSEKAFKLMDLPPEIIHKILNDYQYSPRRLRIIRLVSRQINEWVKHAALHSLDLSHRLQLQLEHIASRPNAFDQVTKTLKLPRMCLGTESLQTALEATTRRIIKKMVAVQTVHWDLRHSSVASGTYEALSQLPLLEKLVIYPPTASFTFWDETYLVLGEKLKSRNLKSFSLSCRSASALAATKCLRDLVASNAGLEELNSWDVQGSPLRTFDFATIVGDTPDEPAFRPSLRVLQAGNLRLSTSPNVTKYLTNLTSLSISNLDPEHDTLWPAFHSCDIQLKELTIEKPTEHLTDYLLEYLGLEKLILARQRRDHHAVAISNGTKIRFLEEGVAHHRNSLVHLGVIYYPCRRESHQELELWALDERQIAWLEQFPKMTTLAVSFAHDGEAVPEGTKISINDALAGLFTRLAPTLLEVELVCGTSEEYGKDGWKQSDYGLIRCVRNFEFIARPLNYVEMRLKIFDGIWRISYHQKRGRSRFVLESTIGEEEKD